MEEQSNSKQAAHNLQRNVIWSILYDLLKAYMNLIYTIDT